MTNSLIINGLIYWALSAFSLWLTALIMPGFRLKSFSVALAAALALGLANIFIRPVLLFLTLPINILTLGLFTFVVNAMVLRLSAAFITGFEITNWFSAIFGAVLLSIVRQLIDLIL